MNQTNISIELIDASKTMKVDNVSVEIKLLAESIKEKGLLHPVTVQSMNGSYRLIAGKRRLHAVVYLGECYINANVFSENEKDSTEMEVISLHENLQRHNLPWHEEVVLTKRLHELRQNQKGTSPTGKPTGGEKKGWSMRDTAEELGIALGKVSTDIQLATALAINPSLKNISDKDTAFKMIKTIKKQVAAEEDTAYVPLKVEADQVMLGEAASILKQLPDYTFHACITDPPWLNFLGDDKLKRVENETLNVFKEIYRVLKPDSFLYVFLGMDDYPEYVSHLKTLNFSIQKYPLIWHKPNVVSRGTRAWEYGRDYEFIMVAVKGSPAKVTTSQESAVLTCNAIHPTQLRHPHEKPPQVIERLIADCTYQGALILDPFGGSGATGVACKNQLRKYFIIEKDKQFYDKIVERLS